jgi:hypothetical protein
VLHYAGWVALVLGEHRQAEALPAESVALHQQSGSAGYWGWPLAQLAYAHWLLGVQARARAELLEVLSTSARQRSFTPLLLALPAVALLLAEHGRVERGRAVRAGLAPPAAVQRAVLYRRLRAAA